jgi:hypothetical protein
MTKLLWLSLSLLTFSSAGFYQNENSDTSAKEQQEAKRLCKLFTEKAETYKKTMRSDDLAFKTLQSYEKRAALYCKTEQK